MTIPLLLLQLAGATAAGAAPPAAVRPDIELRARVRADEVRIRQAGEARLEVHAAPTGVETVDVTRNRPTEGQTTIRDLDLRLEARAIIADPRSPAIAGGTPPEPGADTAPAADGRAEVPHATGEPSP